MASSTTWDVIVLGGANTDYQIRGPRLPMPGETIEGTTFHEGPGGKGANQAVAVARLGARVALIARIGSDRRGNDLVRALEGEGVSTRFVVRDDHAITGVAIIMVDKRGQKKILTAPGANQRLTDGDVDAATEAL